MKVKDLTEVIVVNFMASVASAAGASLWNNYLEDRFHGWCRILRNNKNANRKHDTVVSGFCGVDKKID